MLCCVAPRKRQAYKSISRNPSSVKIDLDEDEGSEMQHILWQSAYNAKVQSSSESKYLQDLAFDRRSLSAAACLQIITEQYRAHGFVRHAGDLKRVLDAVQPFTAAVSALTQSSDIASLTWGSVLFIFQCVLKFVNVFDKVKSMLIEITRLLPRSEAFVNILPTPRLHSALREIYEIFATFCLSTASILQANQIYVCLKLQWSTLDEDFRKTQQDLLKSALDFDREVSLASIQKDDSRHREVLSLLPGAMERPSTIGLIPRNPLFRGREAVIHDLKAHFMPENVEVTNQALPRQTCIISGLGGLGKTQVALEYTYRYRHCYDYIFWLQAEFHTGLTESFLSLARKVRIDSANLTPAKQIELGRDWLECTASKWLLVFDNVETASTVLPFWPAGAHGSILVTTQHTNLALTLPTTKTLALTAMNPEEGSELIRTILRRGNSEKEAAEKLSRELGGHPLAITHYTGYISKSQCVLDDILHFLQRSKRPNLTWSRENVVAIGTYPHTLESIWDMAFTRLSPDAKELLNIIAFLSPECIQQELFVSDKNEEQSQEGAYWSTARFNAAVATLRERNLVDRELHDRTSFLTTHRTLQLITLQKLDEEPKLRQKMFGAARSIVRRALPRQSIRKRGDTSSWPASRAFLPHVTSLHAAFTRSDPAISSDLTFAELLLDAGRFLFEWFWNSDAIPLLQTAINICRDNYEKFPFETEALLPSSLSYLAVYEQCDGISGRIRAREKLIEAVAIQQRYIERVPSHKLTDEDMINLGRFHNDLGLAYLDDYQVQPAEPLFERALEFYERAGGQKSLAVRYGHVYSQQALARLAKGCSAEAQTLARTGCEIIEEILGPESNSFLFYTFSRAVILFNTGQFDDAFALHKDVLRVLQEILGFNHHHTLASRYHVAVCEQARGELESAEYAPFDQHLVISQLIKMFPRHHLREVLKHDVLTYQWREEDIARTAFRLSVVLRQQNRAQEAALYEKQAESLRSEWVDSIPEHVGGDLSVVDSEIARYDYGVWIWHGRTSGMWHWAPQTESKALL